MAFLRLRVSAEMADQLFRDLPFVLRREYDEVVSFEFDLATASGYTTLPIGSLTTVQAVLFQPNQDITVRLAGQTDGGATVSKGGIFTLAGTSISNGSNTAVTIDNNSGSTVVVRGVAFGT